MPRSAGAGCPGSRRAAALPTCADGAASTAAATDGWHLEALAAGQRLPPFRASARVHGARQAYRVDDLDLTIAGSSANGSLQVVQGGPRPRLTGRLTSPLIDLPRLAAATGAARAFKPAWRSLHLADPWRLADIELDLQIERLVFPDGRELQSGSGRLALDDGRLRASALQATVGGGRLTLDGSLADPQNLAGVDAGVTIQGSEGAELSRFFGASIAAVGPYQGRARLPGSLDILRLTAIDAAVGEPGQRLLARGQIDDARHGQGVALSITADISDSTAAGRLFGADLPRLPPLRATARLTGPQGGYVLDDLTLALGRTSMQGRVAIEPGRPRPRVTAQLGGPMLDLSELPPARPGSGATSPALAADVEADIRFERVVLPDRRALGPVAGTARLLAGAVELKQFSAGLDGARMTVDGTIGDPLAPAAIELLVRAEVSHGRGLATFTGWDLQALPAFTASARLSDVPDGYALAGLRVVHAAATVTGDMAVTRGAERYKLSAKAHASLLDASAWLLPDDAGSNAQPAARAMADTQLPIDALRAIDADVELRVDTIHFGDGAPLGPMLVRAVLAEGRLKAEPVRLAGPANQVLDLSATIDAVRTAWDLRVAGQGVDLGALLTRLGHPGVATGGRMDLSLQLVGRGKTLQAIVESLDGDARVEVGPLRVHNFAIDLERGVLMRVFGLANPFQKTDPDTDFQCVVARVPIRDGVLSSDQAVAAETAKVNLVLSGTVNLGTEGIDLAVTPIVKGGRGIGTASIASIVRIGGTLGSPALGLDSVGVAKSAVGAGVALVATPWWLAEAVLKQLSSDPHPCATALAK